MAIKITVRQGGGAGGTAVDVTDQTSVLGGREFAAGHMCGNGAACQYTLTVDDDTNEMPEYGVKAFAAHNVVTISEDAPGSDIWLARGRVARTETFRGDLMTTNAVSHTVIVEDGNVDLRGIVLSADWVRSTETGAARAIALMEAYCQESPRLTTNILTHLVDAPSSNSLDDYTYPAGTPITEVLDDIVSQDGKMYGVVMHHDGGSHLCLLYTGETNHSTYPCTLSITDTDPDLSTEFPPSWRQGAAVHRDGQGVISGVFSKYGMDSTSYVTASGTALVDDYDYWWITNNDTTANTAARAQLRANNLLTYRGQEHITHQVSIKIPADQVHLLAAGMSIDMRSAASAGGEALGTTITRRITQLKWEPIAPEVGAVVGHYYAHMELDRPLRVLPERKTMGPKAPTTPTFNSPAFAEGYADASQAGPEFTYGLDVDGTADTALFVLSAEDESEGAGHVAFTSVQWRPAGGTSPSHNFTKVYGLTNGVQVWMLVDPPAATDAAGKVVCNSSTGHTRLVASAYVTNIDPADPYRDIEVNTGTGTVTSVAPTTQSADLVLNIGGQLANDVGTLAAPTAGGGQTSIGTDTEDANPGQRDGSMGFGRGSSAPTWTFNGSRAWWAVALVVKGEATAGDETQPVGPDGSGTPGDDADTYSPIDHIHEHGYLESGGPYHNADQIAIDDGNNYFTGTDVEAALQEIGADLAGGIVSDHGGLTGLADDDHPQYVRTTDGGKEVINVVAASGTTETLDLGDGNVHDVTLTDDCTFTLTGSTNGVECQMRVLLRQGASPPHTVTWPASVEWVGGEAPTLQNELNTWDWVYLVTLDGGTTWYAQHAGTGGSASERRILLADGRSTPFTFNDLLQMDDGSDFMWSD